MGRLLELSGQVRPGVVQDLVPPLPPVVAFGHVVHHSMGGDQGGRAVLTVAPGKFLEGLFLHLRRARWLPPKVTIR